MPGWQRFYSELKDKNFEIVSVAQDTGGVKDAGPWITQTKLDYTVLIDQEHLVTKLYSMVNVPTGVWINEQGKIVRPNEVAFVDDRFISFSKRSAEEYLKEIRDWVAKGERSEFVWSEQQLKERLTPATPERLRADTEFSLAEYLYHSGHGTAAIAHFKEAQRLDPDNWNYRRQAWLLSDAERDYGTSFKKEVEKLNGKPYYTPRKSPEQKNRSN